MAKIVIGIIGLVGAGKSTFADYLKTEHQAAIFAFRDPLEEALKLLLIDQTRTNLQKLSQVLRENFGQDLLSKILVDRVNKATTEIVCVEGIRRPKDLDYLRTIPNFFLISLDTNEKIRYERLVSRGQNADENAMTFAEFLQKQAAEAESLISEVAREASFVVTNDATKEDFYLQIENVLQKIGEIK